MSSEQESQNVDFYNMTPELDAKTSLGHWDISCSPTRLIRVSLIKYPTTGHWIHFKLFKLKAESGQFFKFQQVYMRWDHICNFNWAGLVPDIVNLKNMTYIPPLETKKGLDIASDLTHVNQYMILHSGDYHKFVVSLKKYDNDNPNSVYVQFRIYKLKEGVFMRNGFINMTVAECSSLFCSWANICNSFWNMCPDFGLGIVNTNQAVQQCVADNIPPKQPANNKKRRVIKREPMGEQQDATVRK